MNIKTLALGSTDALDPLRPRAHTRLTDVFSAAQEIPFDERSKIILFSDCHRGDNSRTDDFRRNENLFLNALGFYHRKGFDYIEVGDGDEMWKFDRHADIVRAHGRTYNMLHQFHQQGRLHLIFGNHDTPGYRHGAVTKDGMMAAEGLILRHAKTGQRVFAVHGHQADLKSDRLSVLGRLVVRHIWRRLQLMGIEVVLRWAKTTWDAIRSRVHPKSGSSFQQLWVSEITQAKKLCEKRIMSWARERQQIVICGHTHRPMAVACGGAPYFNAGSCVTPGFISGVEIHNGEIALVKWSTKWGHAKRELMAPPRKLISLGKDATRNRTGPLECDEKCPGVRSVFRTVNQGRNG